jgi:hypothetical protein
MAVTPAWSSHRIAALRDGNAFEIPADAPGKRKDGSPWLRWARVGKYSGWYAIGTRKMDPVTAPPEESFWSRVYGLCAEVGNGNLDAVHCLGPGTLSVGGLALTLSAGYVPALLARCLHADPEAWLGAMAPAIAISDGVHLTRCEATPAGYALCTADGRPLTDQVELDIAVRAGSEGTIWNGACKRYAHAWVESISRLLAMGSMDWVQLEFCRTYVPRMMPAAVAERIAWPRAGYRDGWMYSREQQALWAVAMALVVEDELQATRMLTEAVQTEPRDATEALALLVLLAEQASGYRDLFRRRVRNSVGQARYLFGVEEKRGMR